MHKNVKKFRFRKGQDATQATVRKLVVNFISTGKVKTTMKRAKIIRSEIDELIHKSQDKSNASRNVLLSRIGDTKIVNRLIDEIGPHFKNRISGFVKQVRHGARVGDGAEIAVVEWIEPMVVAVTKPEVAKQTAQSKVSESKVEEAEVVTKK